MQHSKYITAGPYNTTFQEATSDLVIIKVSPILWFTRQFTSSPANEVPFLCTENNFFLKDVTHSLQFNSNVMVVLNWGWLFEVVVGVLFTERVGPTL